ALAGALPGAPAAPAAATPRRHARPSVGKVVSTAPLKVSLDGATAEVALDPAGNVAVVSPASLTDLRAGDTVAVIGQSVPAAEAGQPAATTAQVVIKAGGARRKKKNQ